MYYEVSNSFVDEFEKLAWDLPAGVRMLKAAKKRTVKLPGKIIQKLGEVPIPITGAFPKAKARKIIKELRRQGASEGEIRFAQRLRGKIIVPRENPEASRQFSKVPHRAAERVSSNILTGRHELEEVAAKTHSPEFSKRFGHTSPQVMINEHNLITKAPPELKASMLAEATVPARAREIKLFEMATGRKFGVDKRLTPAERRLVGKNMEIWMQLKRA